MLYEISGNQDSPAILMFPGSFGSARSMQGYIDLLKEKYYVIAVTLDGCDGSGNSYTSKDAVTDKVLQKVKELGIGRIRLLYGLSMGGANALNFLYKCGRHGITVENILLDGPAVGKIGKLKKWFFDYMNKQQVKMMRSKTVEEYLATPMISKITGGRPEVYRVYIEDMLTVCKDLTDVTSDTVTETCTNQPLAAIPAALQKHMHIWYGKDAMKMFFYKGLRKAYPQAHYRDLSKYGHAMYCIMDPEGYKADNISVIGVSSGGSQALDLITYINEYRQNLEKPGKVICVSPGCVPITQEERKRMEMLEDGDAMVSASFVYSFESISEHWGKYPDWVQHPTVGNYQGLKQIRFYYASNETLAFAVPSFKKVMVEQNVDASFYLRDHMFHAFPVYPVCRESREAYRDILTYLRR